MGKVRDATEGSADGTGNAESGLDEAEEWPVHEAFQSAVVPVASPADDGEEYISFTLIKEELGPFDFKIRVTAKGGEVHETDPYVFAPHCGDDSAGIQNGTREIQPFLVRPL